MRHLRLLLGFGCRPAHSLLVHPSHLWSSYCRAPICQQQKQQQQALHDSHTAQPAIRDGTATTLAAARESPAFLSDEAVSCYHSVDTGSTVYLVGVIHDARRSSKLVERVIRRVQPQVVMVEVDARRIGLLPHGEALQGEDGLCWWSPLHEPEEITAAVKEVRDEESDSIPSIGEDQGLNAMLQETVRRRGQSRKKHNTHDETDKNFCELYTAVVEAVACGARVLLGDRDFEETQRQLLEAEREDNEERARPRHMETGEKPVVEAKIRRRGLESTPPAVWRKLRGLEKAWRPRKFAVLITERDKVMSNNLLGLEGNQDTVAVVGAHHTVGIGSILENNGWKTRR